MKKSEYPQYPTVRKQLPVCSSPPPRLLHPQNMRTSHQVTAIVFKPVQWTATPSTVSSHTPPTPHPPMQPRRVSAYDGSLNSDSRRLRFQCHRFLARVLHGCNFPQPSRPAAVAPQPQPPTAVANCGQPAVSRPWILSMKCNQIVYNMLFLVETYSQKHIAMCYRFSSS